MVYAKPIHHFLIIMTMVSSHFQAHLKQVSQFVLQIRTLF
ncbi:ferredoxin [Streptococcus pyogenes MGAS2111]|nr:ferredoxin [Streptococcus pyogenes MGAS2111]